MRLHPRYILLSRLSLCFSSRFFFYLFNFFFLAFESRFFSFHFYYFIIHNFLINAFTSDLISSSLFNEGQQIIIRRRLFVTNDKLLFSASLNNWPGDAWITYSNRSSSLCVKWIKFQLSIVIWMDNLDEYGYSCHSLNFSYIDIDSWIEN